MAMNPAPSSSTPGFFGYPWGPVEIQWLYSKLQDIEQKLAAPGLGCTGCQPVLTDLGLRVMALDDRVNVLRQEIDSLSQSMADVQKSTATLQEGLERQSNAPYFDPTGHLATVIKEERDDFGSASLPPFADSILDGWNGTPIYSADASASPVEHDAQSKGYSTRTRTRRAPKATTENRKRSADEVYDQDEINEVTSESLNSNAKKKRSFVIEPDPELMAKAKELLGEIKIDKATGMFKCPECPKQFGQKRDLSRHHLMHTGIKPFSCAECQEKFGRQDKLQQHMKTYHSSDQPPRERRPLVPKKAKKKGPSRNATLSAEDLICKLCPETETQAKFTPEKLAEHYTTEHGPPGGLRPIEEFSIPCSRCGKPCLSKPELETHERTHLGMYERPYTCPSEQCRRTFFTARMAQKHRRNVHQSPEEVEADKCRKEILQSSKPKHLCSDCGKGFHMKYKLVVHLPICRGLKPYLCGECGKSFAQMVGLQQHQAGVHKKVKRYICSDCGKGFFGSGAYKSHMNAHRGLTPYLCKYCGRHFSSNTTLQRHEQIHIGVRKHKCPHCDLKFFRPHTLKRHMLVHTGERPYPCDICGMSFSQKGSMTKHKECHTRGSPGAGRLSTPGSRTPRPRVESKPRESRVLRQLGLVLTPSQPEVDSGNAWPLSSAASTSSSRSQPPSCESSQSGHGHGFSLFR